MGGFFRLSGLLSGGAMFVNGSFPARRFFKIFFTSWLAGLEQFYALKLFYGAFRASFLLVRKAEKIFRI